MPSKIHPSAKAAIDRLKDWLAAGHAVPRRNGLVNRSDLCKAVGIPVSTLRTNKHLGAIVSSLDRRVSSPVQPFHPSLAPISDVELGAAGEMDDRLEREPLALKWLLDTGRCVRI